jgi:excisionase family DNA binding protein
MRCTKNRVGGRYAHGMAAEGETTWLGTALAARRMGITTRTLYKFIDAGELPAYKFGRVIRLKQADVDAFIEAARVEPGSLEHLYPDARNETDDSA